VRIRVNKINPGLQSNIIINVLGVFNKHAISNDRLMNITVELTFLYEQIFRAGEKKSPPPSKSAVKGGGGGFFLFHSREFGYDFEAEGIWVNVLQKLKETTCILTLICLCYIK
jgi:hypothetical protein